jgi:hypothetical protein
LITHKGCILGFTPRSRGLIRRFGGTDCQDLQGDSIWFR